MSVEIDLEIDEDDEIDLEIDEDGSQLRWISTPKTHLERAEEPVAGLEDAFHEEGERQDDQHHDHAAVLGHDLCGQGRAGDGIH